jgi:prepilin-type N-terminal cleavage/methylation domain-containing protein
MQEEHNNVDNASESGFTLIELLIAIVVAGILTAVAIVGIAGLTNSGEKSACKSSADAARAATAVFYANSASEDASGRTYPGSLADLTQSTPPLLELPDGGTETATSYSVNGWTLTMTPGEPPTYACS